MAKIMVVICCDDDDDDDDDDDNPVHITAPKFSMSRICEKVAPSIRADTKPSFTNVQAPHVLNPPE